MAYKNHKEDKYCKDAGICLQEGACGEGIGGADMLEWAGEALNEDIWDDEEEEERAAVSQSDEEIMKTAATHTEERIRRMNAKVLGLVPGLFGSGALKDGATVVERILSSAGPSVSAFSPADKALDLFVSSVPGCLNRYNEDMTRDRAVQLLEGGLCGDSRVVVAVDGDGGDGGGTFVMSPVPLNLVEDQRGGDLKGVADDAVRWLEWVSGIRARHAGSRARCWMQRYGVPYPLCWQSALMLDLDVPVSEKDTGGFSADTGAVMQDAGGWWSLRGVVYSILKTLLDAEAVQAGGAPREILVDLAANSTYFKDNRADLIQTANQGSVVGYFRDCVITDAEKVTQEARVRMGLEDADRLTGVLATPLRVVGCSDSALAKVVAPAIKYGMAAAVQSFLDCAGAAVLDAVTGAFRERYGYSMLSIGPEEIRGIRYRVTLDGVDAAGWKAQADSEAAAFNGTDVAVVEKCITDPPGYSLPMRKYKVKLLQTGMLYDAYMSNGGATRGKGKKSLAESSLEYMADRLYEDIWDDEEEEENTVQSDDEIIQDARRNITERHVKDADSDIALLVQMLNSISITSYASDVYEYEINSAVVLSSAASAAPGIRVTRFSEDRGTGDVFQKDGLYYVDSARRLNRDTCGALLDAGLCRGNSVVVWEQGSNRNLMVMAPLPVQLVEDQDGGGSLTGMAADGVQWLSEANSLIAEGKIRRVILGRGVQREGVPYCTTGWMSALFCNIQNDSDINPDDIISGQPLKQKAFVAGGDAWSWWSVQRIACWVLHVLAKMEAADPVLTGGMIKVELASDDEYFYSRIPGMPSHSSAVMNFCNNALNDTEETLHRMRELFGSAVRDDACAALVGRISMWDRRSRDKAAGLLVPAAKYGIVSAAEAALNAMMPAVLSDILKLFEDTYGYPLLNAGRAALENMRYKVILDGKDTAGWKDEMMSAVDAFNTEGIEITEYDVYDKSGTAIRKYTARAVPLEALYDAYMSGEPGKKRGKRTVESAAGAGGNILYDIADRLYEDIWDDEEEEEAAAENTAAADDETYSRETLKGSGELGRKTLHRMLREYSKEIDASCGFYHNDENAVLTGVVGRCPYYETASYKNNFFVQAQRKDSGTISFDSRAEGLIIQNDESHEIKEFKMMPSVILSEITDETDTVRKKSVVYNDAFYAIMPCTVMIATSPEKCANNEFTKCARIHPEIDEYFDLPTVVPPACGIYPSTGCGLFSDAPANSTEHYGASFHNILREILLQAAMQDGKFCLDYIVPDWQMKFFSSGGSYRGFNILTEYTGSIIWCDTAFCRKYRLNTDSGSIRLKEYLTGARQNLKAMHLLSSLLLYDIAVYMNRFADTVSDVLNTLADGNEDNLYYINSLVGGASVSGSFTVNGKTLDQCAADRDAALAEIRNNGLNLLINMDGQGTGPMHSKIYRFTAEPITADR